MKTGAKVALILAGVGALACGGIFTAVIASTNQAVHDINQAANAPLPTPIGAPSAQPKRKASSPAKAIGNGLWKVGTDVAPGTYVTSGAKDEAVDLCYWDTRKGTGTDHILEQGMTQAPGEQGTVTLTKGTYFKSQGCETWQLQ